jgi:DNA-directed RNA polymerase specialized sigma24 family protein
MTERGSVTGWLDGLRAGDDVAAQRLWEGYFRRLVGLARARLAGRPAGPAGSEDVALSAFDSFCRAVAAGRFPRLSDRNDLWQILVMLTARKAIDAVDRELADKRGGGAIGGGSSLEGAIGSEPTPAFAAEVADQCRALLDQLRDPDLRRIALWKLEGYTNAEIAGLLDKSVVTVERKLNLIRDMWEAPPEGD